MKQSGAPLQGKRILIIEDTPENMRLFRAILKMEDATVLEAERAAIGIELARREQPDLILMDMQMPEMDGLSATKILRADPQTQDIPIIIVTASAMSDDKKRAFAAGCNGYITKPVDPMSMIEQLGAFFPNTATP